jgi:hypothetical protein
MVMSPFHSRDVFITSHRHLHFEAMAQRVMREMGVPILDVLTMSQSQWGACLDGVHYLKVNPKGNNKWYGRVAYMGFQLGLNVIFPTCGGL